MEKSINTDDAGMAGAYDNEHWGPPTKHERYSRVKNIKQYKQNYDEIEWKSIVDPSKGRRFHKTYSNTNDWKKQ